MGFIYPTRQMLEAARPALPAVPPGGPVFADFPPGSWERLAAQPPHSVRHGGLRCVTAPSGPTEETPMAQYVCNVQAWGASPTYTEGQPIPEDCPYDVEAAAKSGKVVTVEEYKQAHPGWDPEAQTEADQAKAEFAKEFPGRDLPTAADPPEPEAEKALYEEPAPSEPTPTADKPPEGTPSGGTPTGGEPVQVQQGSTAPPPKPSGSKG